MEYESKHNQYEKEIFQGKSFERKNRNWNLDNEQNINKGNKSKEIPLHATKLMHQLSFKTLTHKLYHHFIFNVVGTIIQIIVIIIIIIIIIINNNNNIINDINSMVIMIIMLAITIIILSFSLYAL